MTRLLRLLILTLVIGCVALFSGVVAQEYGSSQTPAAAGNQMGDPNVTITSPEANASIAVGNVTVEVNVTNFTLVEPTGQPNAPGEGHLHYYLDAPVPTNESEPAIPPVGGYVISTNLSHTWENVTPGEHNLSVQLVNNDHTPLIPLVFETINVTVGENATGNVTGNATPAAGGGTTTVDLTAQDIRFDASTITVPAGAEVTVNFNNMDDGVPHNFAVYDSSLRSEQIFVGDIITGPAMTTYTFTAPEEPGTYYFQCDVHPDMNGDFIVE
ncbi:cupredoxin domain-containing protein [Methanoculleus sp.]|jgi:plastocyanin|uniref:cupredoxin domain-containing protein n=1 Tax=Methanoculleus sp. TaxID=90427 RepID=UPI002608CEF8|nr:cupredoxin domain-containing protein [Methanoculleus sp.]MDI6867814.1 cupredoxin domain-containing protein [Methanoculleus sp.]